MSKLSQPSQPEFTLAEILSLVKAVFKMSARKDPELEEQIAIINGVSQPKTVVEQAMEAVLLDTINNIVAEKLFKDDRQKRILTSADLQNVAPKLVQIQTQADGVEPTDSERSALEKFATSFFCGIIDAYESLFPEGSDEYTVWWKYLRAIRDVMADYPVHAIELHFDKEQQEEVSRRVFTKKEFSDTKFRAINKLLNIEFVKRVVFDPLFNALAEQVDANEMKRLREEFDATVVPEVAAKLNKVKEVSLDRIARETDRIFG